MAARRIAPWTPETRLRVALGLLFVALAAPTAFLVWRSFDRLEAEALSQRREAAEQLVRAIDDRLADALVREQSRAFEEYGFVLGDSALLQRSPLSAFPVEVSLPGLIGHFQVGPEGEFSTPLAPAASDDLAAYGIGSAEAAARLDLQRRIHDTLARQQLAPAGARRDLDRSSENKAEAGSVEETRVAAVQGAATEAEPGLLTQSAFDDLAAGSDRARPARQAPAAESPQSVAEASAVSADEVAESPPAIEEAEGGGPAQQRLEASQARIVTFDSELDPFVLGRLGSGHLVLFRNAWQDGRRFVQGALVDADRFLAETAGSAMSLLPDARVAVSYLDEPLGAFGGTEMGDDFGTAFLTARLSPPFAAFELAFSAPGNVRGPGFDLLVWVAATLSVLLVGGFVLMYRMGLQQIRLTRQQQDFVSAVSHELKTPLTSIRMYGEMLKAGWAEEERKQTYYEYIYEESERLSRLIENVLQLARMTRGRSELELGACSVGELLDLAESKVATLAERAGFELDVARDPTADSSRLAVDADGFAQILINLVDNAIKFSAGAERKRVELQALADAETVTFTVRDYGPGVPRARLRKLFELFYRSDDAVTRSARGTGIGLAVVHQLAAAMRADVDVVNRHPGAEFRVRFPLLKSRS